MCVCVSMFCMCNKKPKWNFLHFSLIFNTTICCSPSDSFSFSHSVSLSRSFAFAFVISFRVWAFFLSFSLSFFMPGLEVRVFGLEFHQRTCNIIFHLHKFNFQTGWDSVRIFSLFPLCILSHATTARLHIGVGVGVISLLVVFSLTLSLYLSLSLTKTTMRLQPKVCLRCLLVHAKYSLHLWLLF